MKYILALGALLLGALSSVEAHTYYTYPTYPTYVYEQCCEEYVPQYPVHIVRRIVAPVRYFYPTYRMQYCRYYKSSHRRHIFRGGFSF